MEGRKVGWIGTGVMGLHMAKHIVTKQGICLSIYNRTASKADELIKLGCSFKSAKEIAQEVDYLFLMLGYPHDVEDMLLHPETGILQHMKKGAYLIDHTTSTPSLAMRIAEQAETHGVKSVDAPVSGGDIGARGGCLVSMCGGKQTYVDEVRPLLLHYSQSVEWMGEAGAGQHTKAANQIMISNTLFGVCEALIYGQKAGLNLDQMIKLLNKGAAGSAQLEKLAPRMLRRDFEPGFYVEHFVKDLGIALGECKRMGIQLPGMTQSAKFFDSYIEQGGARQGTQGFLQVLERLNQVDVRKYDI